MLRFFDCGRVLFGSHVAKREAEGVGFIEATFGHSLGPGAVSRDCSAKGTRGGWGTLRAHPPRPKPHALAMPGATQLTVKSS